MREEFGLTMTVVFDPGAIVGGFYGTNDLVVVTAEDGEIVFKQRYAPLSAVRAAIEAELDRGP